MSRPIWPPRYVNIPIPALRESELPNAAFRFYCKLRALAWGEATLTIAFDKLMKETGLSKSRVYEYAGLCRDRLGLPFHCAAGSFECSFPDLPDIPEKQELPTLSLSKPKSKNTAGEGRSQKTGMEKLPVPAAVQAFRSIANRYPDKAVWPQISAAVGDDPASLDRWQKTIQGWIAAGFYKLNVGGMLDWYGQGRTSKAGPLAPTKSNGNGRGPVLPEGLLDG